MHLDLRALSLPSQHTASERIPPGLVGCKSTRRYLRIMLPTGSCRGEACKQLAALCTLRQPNPSIVEASNYLAMSTICLRECGVCRWKGAADVGARGASLGQDGMDSAAVLGARLAAVRSAPRAVAPQGGWSAGGVCALADAVALAGTP